MLIAATIVNKLIRLGIRAPNPGPEPKLRTNRATTLNLNLNHVCYISKAYFARLPMSWRLGSPSRPRIRAPNRTSGDYTQLEFEPCLLHLWVIVCKAARTIYPFHGDWAPHPGPESSNIRRLRSTWIWTMLVTSLRHSLQGCTYHIPISWRLGSPSGPRIRGPNLRTSGDYTQLEFEPCLLHL